MQEFLQTHIFHECACWIKKKKYRQMALATWWRYSCLTLKCLTSWRRWSHDWKLPFTTVATRLTSIHFGRSAAFIHKQASEMQVSVTSGKCTKTFQTLYCLNDIWWWKVQCKQTTSCFTLYQQPPSLSLHLLPPPSYLWFTCLGWYF